jgi:HD-GYP domain-containing protein (c-di-GMP phosphodiesterase class II)
MNLVPLPVQSIRLNQPLPYHLVDKTGLLLAKKGFVIETERYLVEIANRGGGIYIDLSNPDNQSPFESQRAFVDELHTMVRKERSLGEIANARAPKDAGRKPGGEAADRIDWMDLQVQCNLLLRGGPTDTFVERLDTLVATLLQHTQRNPDGTLFALFYLSASEIRMYSATHSMLVGAMCVLAAKEVLEWPTPDMETLLRAALTMNIGMTALQDHLAMQRHRPDAQQQAQIDAHAERSVAMLQAAGIQDMQWLDAVRNHHAQLPGPLAARNPADRMARLLQRADTFGARMAPRTSRVPSPSAVAMKSCYFDELGGVDEAGAALIKAVGVYQPGTFVRLVTGEIAVVVRRGANTSSPKVAVVLNRSGIPTAEPMSRDTAAKAYAIAASVPQREVKVNLHLERMLALTQSTGL